MEENNSLTLTQRELKKKMWTEVDLFSLFLRRTILENEQKSSIECSHFRHNPSSFPLPVISREDTTFFSAHQSIHSEFSLQFGFFFFFYKELIYDASKLSNYWHFKCKVDIHTGVYLGHSNWEIFIQSVNQYKLRTYDVLETVLVLRVQLWADRQAQSMWSW